MPGYASAETKAAFTVSYTRFDGLVDRPGWMTADAAVGAVRVARK
jgi:hypothetical protein